MRLYFKYLRMLVRSQLEYRESFIMTLLGQFLVSFSAFLGIYFIIMRFNTVRDYTFPEILICFSSVLASFSLAECFARGFDAFPRLIKSGSLDRLLLRPRGVAFQVLTSNLELSRAGRLLQAIFMLIYAVPRCGVVWTADKIATLAVMIGGGVLVFTALFILYAGFSFFTIEGLEFMNLFTDGVREFGQYPLSIYGEGVLKLFTYVIPVALFQYYPFLYLVGRSDDKRLALLPILGAVFILPCSLFFRLGLRRYKSTGS